MTQINLDRDLLWSPDSGILQWGAEFSPADPDAVVRTSGAVQPIIAGANISRGFGATPSAQSCQAFGVLLNAPATGGYTPYKVKASIANQVDDGSFALGFGFVSTPIAGDNTVSQFRMYAMSGREFDEIIAVPPGQTNPLCVFLATFTPGRHLGALSAQRLVSKGPMYNSAVS